MNSTNPRSSVIRLHRAGRAAAVAAALAAAAVGASPPVVAQAKSENAASPEALLSAVVGIKARALPDARSNATLGRDREGTGIVIDEQGHILTIGYLVLEPDSIEVRTIEGRTAPATLVAFDHPSGFGLLRAQAPLAVQPMALGDSAKVAEQDPVLVLPAGGRENASVGRVMSTRRFTGSWEYLLDSALFVSPPTMTWAGAALVSRDMRLVGVGSLLVRDAVAPGTPSPGNMYVPIDLLKPILKDLIAQGKRPGPQRPWLGLATEEVQGRLVVTRVSPDAPADRAGIRRGDIVLAVGKDAVGSHADLYRRIWAIGAAGVDVPLRILQGAESRDVNVKSIDRVEYFARKAGT